MAENKNDAKETNEDRKVGRGPDSGTGAFAGTQHGGSNDGVTSAKPQTITGQEDASFQSDPDKATTKDVAKDI